MWNDNNAALREFVSSIFVSFSYLFFSLYSHMFLLCIKYFLLHYFVNILKRYFLSFLILEIILYIPLASLTEKNSYNSRKGHK